MLKYIPILLLFSCSKSVMVTASSQPGTGTDSTVSIPPKTNVDVDYYIEAGQSNCGRPQFPGTGSTGDSATPEQVSLYGNPINGFQIYNPGYSAVTFYRIQAGVNTMLVDHLSNREMGSEVSFLTSLKNAGVDSCFILKYGIGNTDLANDWLNKYIYQLFIYADKNIRIIKAAGNHPVLKAFIWIQGENDAADSIKARSYLDNFTAFFAKFDSFYNAEIATYNLSPNSINYKKIIGRVNGIDDPSEKYREIVRSAQADYCSSKSNNAILINTDNYPTFNNGHYTLSGQIQFGIDIFDALNGRLILQ